MRIFLEYDEIMMQKRSGEVLHLIQNVSVKRDKQNQITRFLGYLFDNTDRKRLEEQLLQAQTMKSIGTLAGGIAHNFNNYLGIIKGHISLLEIKLGNRPDLAKHLSASMNAVDRGANLVDGILQFARRSDTTFNVINLNGIIRDVKGMISETFPRSISFDFSLSEYLPPIWADANAITQVILNLCINSRDAMENQGEIKITSGLTSGLELKKQFQEAENDSYVFVKVADNGTGMDDQTRNRIFEPFFTTKAQGKGTGLGLAMAFGTVSRHHGFISCESQLGKGTTFNVLFARYREEAQQD